MDESHEQERIDLLISSFFSAFDNRNGLMPRLAGLTECFTENAIIAQRTGTGITICTVRDFATPRIELLTKGELKNFHEWEVSSTNQIFDGIASRTSRYRKSGLLNGGDYSGSGTKCFQLVELGVGWRIASLAWVDDKV